MRDHMPIRARMKSWRTAVAIAGVAAMAVTLGQSVSTLANPNDAVSTDGSQIATGNFFPTPLTSAVRCRTTGSHPAAYRAEVSWDAVEGVTGYILELVQWDSNNPNATVRHTHPVTAPTTSVSGIADTGRHVLYARVRTVNGPAVSSGYATPPQRISFKAWLGSETWCENTGHPGVPNPPWEDTTEWNPASPAPASVGQQTVMAAQHFAPAAELDQAEEGPAEANAEAGEGEPGETRAPATGETIEAASPSSTTPATTRPPVTPHSSATAVPSQSTSTRSATTAKPTTAPTSGSPSSSASPTTTTTRPPNESVRLPGGGQAEIVDGTKLVVSGTGTPQCSVTVRKGSTLEVREGVLELADAVETRAVGLDSCELSKV
ncbi:hypothetical protein GCM10022294_24450 [Dietzia aurantiaca]